MKKSSTSPFGSTGADFLLGGGEMGDRIRSFNWSSHPLGPIETWPQSLKIVIRIMLTSRYAMWMGWGPEFYFFCNDSYLPTVGIKESWVLGASARKVWAEIWDDIGPRAESVVETGKATWDESLLLFLERSGYAEETYHTFSYSPVPNDDGSVGGMLCVVTEDTERVIGERRLALLRDLASDLAATKTEEEMFDAVCERCAPYDKDLPFALVYLFDADAKQARLTCSHGAAAQDEIAPSVINLDNEDAVWPARELLSQPDARTILDLAGRFDSLPTGPWDKPPRQAVLVPISQQGQSRPAGFLVAGINPYRPFDEAYSGFINLLAGQIAAGLSNARAYEAERQRAEALAELDRAKTAFFSNVSHEFRTPLTLMLGPLDDILEKPGNQILPENRELLTIIHRNGQRLLKLVNTLLDFSRIEAGRVQAVYEPADLAAYTADLASVFRAAVDKAGMRLVIDCPTLPEPVYVDRDMWEKIVLNLVSNAFKYTLHGEIRVSVRAEGGAAVLSVADTGIGIPESELPKLFNRFHRIEGARGRTHEGTGIGLALVLELAKLHGGTVGVQSVYGQGSTFTVSVPFGTAHLPADRIGGVRTLSPTALGAEAFVEEVFRWGAAADSRDGTLPKPGSNGTRPSARSEAKARIVLADDNADMRDYVRRLLDADYEVIAVADGQQALRAAAEYSPDLVLTDVMMPNLDGFGLLKALRKDARTASTPVIMLSARAGEEARIEGLDAGADDYLIKPFSARELLARVGGTLHLAKLRSEAIRREEELKAETTSVLESINEAFAALDKEFRFTYVNSETERIYQMPRREILGQNIWELFPATLGTAIDREFHRAMGDRVAAKFQVFYEPWRRWFEVNANPAKDGGLSIYFRDISDRKRMEVIVEGQNQALEMAVDGAPLEEILNVLTQTVEAQSTNQTIASVLLLDPDGIHLRHGAAPSLPESYNRAIDGLEIGPLAGSCGTAAFTGQSVVVSDIAADRRWAPYRDLALGHDLRACWSTPIFSSRGRVLGTFALYYRERCNPMPRDQKAVDLLIGTAAVIIERHHETQERVAAEHAVRENEQRYRQLVQALPVAVYTCDAGGRILLYNEAAVALWGREPEVGKEMWCGSHRVYWPDGMAMPLDQCPTAQTILGGLPAKAVEIIIERPDGTRRDVLTHPHTIQDASGAVVGGVNVLVDITERKRAEADLAATRDDLAMQVAALTRLHELSMQLSGLLDLPPALDAILKTTIELHDADFGLLSLYDPAADLLRVGASAGLDEASLEALDRVTPSPDAGACGSAFASKKRAIIEDVETDPRFDCYRGVAHGAGFRAVHSTPILTRAGEILGILSVHFKDRRRPTQREMLLADLCARHAAEAIEAAKSQQAIRESEERFRNMADNAPVMVWVTEPDGECTFLSKSWYEFTGQTPETGLGSGWLEAIHQDDLPTAHETFAMAIVQQQAFRLEHRLRHHDGEYRWALDAAIPRLSSDGRFLGYIGSIIDITDRKRIEKQLAESHNFLHSSLDALSSHIAVLDESGAILAVNEAWRRFADENQYTGRNYGVGSNYLEECEPSSSECLEGRIVADGIREVLAGRQESFELEYPCHSPTEQRFFVMRVTRFNPPGPVRVVVAHENVTERRLAVDALKEADRRKDEFLATLAHELRNPLAPIRNGLRILQLAGNNRDTAEQARHLMERQLQQMVRLIDDLLDLSRISRGKIELRREHVDLSTVLQNAVETSRPLIEQAGHELRLSLPPEPILVDADLTRLAQVFANLLNNAAKYTEKGGCISLSAAPSGEEVVVSVKDNGVGIPPEMLSRVFEMFTQVDRSLEKTRGGLGIGLSITRRLVEMHGGTVEAHSDGLGMGSEFIVRLPNPSSPLEKSRTESENEASNNSAHRRILVADDNEDSAEAMAMMLRLMGNEVRTAHDGLQAVRLAETFRPEVILLDIGMPEMNGYDACRHIRQQPWGKAVVLVALTGWGQEEDKRRSLEAGFDHHLVKPVDPNTLDQLLTTLTS